MKDKNNIGLIFLIYEQAMISFFFSFEELTLLDFNLINLENQVLTRYIKSE
jgi:hypothetical protein